MAFFFLFFFTISSLFPSASPCFAGSDEGTSTSAALRLRRTRFFRCGNFFCYQTFIPKTTIHTSAVTTEAGTRSQCLHERAYAVKVVCAKTADSDALSVNTKLTQTCISDRSILTKAMTFKLGAFAPVEKRTDVTSAEPSVPCRRTIVLQSKFIWIAN